VIRRPALYLFDDAFSALDVRTDARVRAALGEVSATATVVIVSQRISTVLDADQIVVIDDGRVVGTGTHSSLLADCPVYVEFADSQAVGVR
ncbi:MAG: ABC transporter ATP-binding protein, partial [Mycobacterium sp.]